MDNISVTRPSPPSTKSIVADEGFCRQAAALLLCDEEPIRDTFIGEPVEEVLEMVRWALSHEDDEGFDTAEVLNEIALREGLRVFSSYETSAGFCWIITEADRSVTTILLPEDSL